MRQLLQDLRFAVRSVRSRRAVAAIAILTVALGVGAATAIYSVVDGVLLKALPYPDANRLVAVWFTSPEMKKDPILARQWDRIPLSMPEYRDLRRLSVIDDAAIWQNDGATLSDADPPQPVGIVHASASMLDVLGERPYLGRMYLPGEDVPDGARVTLISYESWTSQYGKDPHIIGRAVHLNDVAYTVIGVLPPGLTIGRQSSGSSAATAAFWLPAGYDTSNYSHRDNHSYPAIARLRSGVSIEQARVAIDRLLHDEDHSGVRLTPWQADQVRDARAPLLLLLAAVAVLLGIACVNVAVLLLGEAVTRQHEMATRRALGASAWRLVRQTLTESLVVGLAGGVVGLAVGAWGTRGLVALAPPSIPGLADVSMNLRVLGFALCIAIITGVLFGLAPALLSSGTAPALLLRAGMGQSRRRRGALQRILVAAELALSVVLLVGAGLLGRSFEKVTAVDPGFRTEHLLVARVALPRAVVGDTARVTRFYTGLVAELRALPGVTGATLGTQPPFSGGWSSTMIRREGEPDSVGHETQQRIVVPGYFATLGIPLLAGRDFSAADRGDTPEVAIVSEALARRDFPTESPLGKRVLFHDRWRTIVGVVGDVHLQKLSRVLEPSIYTPAAQNGTATMEALVRTAGDPSKLTGTVRATVRRTEPRAALWTLDQMSDLMERSFADERYRTMLIALFGVVAVILAAVGMYGVTARAAARRQHEIGIRLALGATSGSVVRLVIGQTLAGVAVGVAIGLLGAFATGPLLSPFLFGVHAMDAVTYTGIVAFLVCVSLTASWLPARRAGRRELAEVLREE